MTIHHAPALSADEVWARIRGAWPGFEFMWEHGSSAEEIAAAEARLGVTLPARARALLGVCGGAGFPTCAYGRFTAETCLDRVASWSAAAGTEIVEMLGWDTETAARHVRIGVDPWGADYGIYTILRPGTGEVFGLTLNIPELKPLGPFDEWLLTQRLGDKPGSPRRVYVEAEETPEEIAARHRSYIEGTPRAARWHRIEHEFIEAVRRLRRGAQQG